MYLKLIQRCIKTSQSHYNKLQLTGNCKYTSVDLEVIVYQRPNDFTKVTLKSKVYKSGRVQCKLYNIKALIETPSVLLR